MSSRLIYMRLQRPTTLLNVLRLFLKHKIVYNIYYILLIKLPTLDGIAVTIETLWPPFTSISSQIEDNAFNQQHFLR
jgi:hypothetical protein